MDLDSLRTDLASYSHRDDYTDADRDGWIEKAYEQLNSVLRLRQMETAVTAAFVSGSYTVPSDFLEIRTITRPHASGVGFKELPGVSKAELGQYGHGQYSMVHYLEGETILLAPEVSADHTLTYFAAVAVPTTGTDFLMTRYPTMVLDACLEQLHKWERDDEARRLVRDSWMAEAVKANAEANRTRMAGRPRAQRPSRAASAVRAI